MNETQQPGYHPRGWLDRFAIGMAALCAVHCLLMPILLIALPIFATSLFAHEDFHLWMLWLVLPSTGVAIFLGCRKHQDRWTPALSIVGLAIVTSVALHDGLGHGAVPREAHLCSGCAQGHGPARGLPTCAWLNTLGGLFIAAAHTRNFHLCRKGLCAH